MKQNIFICCLLLFILEIKDAFESFSLSKQSLTKPTSVLDQRANKIILVEPDIYYLYWVHTNTDIFFEIHVKTDGWASFGVSRHGDMQYSDVIVTWVNSNGSYHFSDRHIYETKQPVLDQEQNWFPINIIKEDGYLKAMFTRKIIINSKNNEDIDIATGSPFVVFAWGAKSANDISYHGPENRGQMGVNLLKIKSFTYYPPNVIKNIEFRINTTLINDYYCHLFKHSDQFLSHKNEILKFEALITPGNEDIVHHIGLNECSIEFETEYLKNNGLPEPGPCYFLDGTRSAWSDVIKYCRTFSLMWSDYNINKLQDISNKTTPNLFKSSDLKSKYFFIYVHHYNPDLIKKIDNSGFRIRYKN